MTPARAGAAAAVVLLACYVLTLAPGITFWDSGELVAAAHGLGIPHPPGTPLYVLLGRAWLAAAGPALGVARGMNLLSSVLTACAGGLTAWLLARESGDRGHAVWGALAGALSAGLMATAWSNATETEVYSAAMLLAAAMLAAAARAGDAPDGDERWLLCTVYLIALAPALHLSALLGAPACVALAARRRDGAWMQHRLPPLVGAVVMAAGVGRVSPALCLLGAIVALVPVAGRGVGSRRHALRLGGASVLLAALAATALLAMLVRARHDPPLNQGNPATLASLAEVVGRRQYDVAPLFPRQAPVWLQLANLAQYADWQVALGWGRGIFTTPARVLATIAFVALAWEGARALRRDHRRLGDALVVLLASGTIGAGLYLNLKAGTSLGWGVLPDGTPHEARERDYFFVIGFWAWGCLVGFGALAVCHARRWRASLACGVAVLPLLGNWRAVDRSRLPDAEAPMRVARGILGYSPANAVLFASGDNDSYPLWYAQQVEGFRRDVIVVTLPLLPADWYAEELRRRVGARWSDDEPVPGARLRHEQRGALLARWAAARGRPVAASPAITTADRDLLGADWTLRGPVYVAAAAAGRGSRPATVDTAAAVRWMSTLAPLTRRGPPPVDGVAAAMWRHLSCARLALPPRPGEMPRDSLELSCNLR